MDKLLKAKHWQVFTLILLGVILSNFTIENDSTTTLIINLVGNIIYFIYPLIIGYFLQDYLPNKVLLNTNLFLINIFVWIAAYFTVLIILDGNEMTFNGLAALPVFYLIFAAYHIQAFPAKTLKSAEMKTEANFGDYFGDLMLIIFLPIGIWFLQPRINKVVKNTTVTA